MRHLLLATDSTGESANDLRELDQKVLADIQNGRGMIIGQLFVMDDDEIMTIKVNCDFFSNEECEQILKVFSHIKEAREIKRSILANNTILSARYPKDGEA